MCCYGMHNDRSIRGMSFNNAKCHRKFIIGNIPLLFIVVGKYQTSKFLISRYLCYILLNLLFCFPQNKSVHFPLRSKYNRLTKVARFLQENPSCLLCNILHHYLHQANYSIIDDATMVSYWNHVLVSKKPPFYWVATERQGLR